MRGWPVRAREGRISGPVLDTPWARELAEQIRHEARRARRELVVLLPLLAAVLLVYVYRVELLGTDQPVRIAAVIALVILGWAFARALGRALGPTLFRRLDRGTAGTVSFLIRLFAVGLAVLVALRVAGLDPQALATGTAVTAVLLGLAAQQTLGNLFAGTVLLSARPFRLGDRIRLQSGSLGHDLEGTVIGLGLLYTVLRHEDRDIMVPNNIVLSSAIMPLRDPEAVSLRASLPRDVAPSDVQSLLDDEVSVSTRDRPHVRLESVDSDRVVVCVVATPESEDDGPRLADEMLAAITTVSRDGDGANGHGSSNG
jgi:small conductance mechanosensitive channel